MGKVVIHATISLDGYIAGPNDDLSWMSPIKLERMQVVESPKVTDLRFRIVK